MAEVALHRCVHREYTTNDKGSCDVSKIEYSYEFLDDFTTSEPNMSMFVNMFSWKKNNQAENFEDTTTKDSVSLQPIPTIQGPHYQAVTSQEDLRVESAMGGVEGQESWLQEKYDPQNHPLELMVCVCLHVCSLI